MFFFSIAGSPSIIDGFGRNNEGPETFSHSFVNFKLLDEDREKGARHVSYAEGIELKSNWPTSAHPILIPCEQSQEESERCVLQQSSSNFDERHV